MATYNKLPSGKWRAQIRRKGPCRNKRYSKSQPIPKFTRLSNRTKLSQFLHKHKRKHASKSFRLKSDAETWAIETERAIDLGRSVTQNKLDRQYTIGDLIDLHITDMLEVAKPLLRSKSKTLEKLKSDIGSQTLNDITRESLIAYCKRRAKNGAGPATVGMDLGYLRTILVHASSVHGIETPTGQVMLARVALRRLGLIGKGQERDRRPTQNELDLIIGYYNDNPRQLITLGRIVKFAVATGMRRQEICSITWPDINLETRLATVRNRKDPRRKQGNHQQVPLLVVTGYDAIAILREQRQHSPFTERAFPYNGRSVGTAFRRACRKLSIIDLRFHDLRHEATSRLFEAGFDIPEVSLVTGHKDWQMLRRYLNLQPHQLLHRKAPQRRYANE